MSDHTPAASAAPGLGWPTDDPTTGSAPGLGWPAGPPAPPTHDLITHPIAEEHA